MVSPVDETTQFHPELERLICAAVSNNRFAASLLTAPESALDCAGHSQHLSPTEREMVTSIHGARDIYDFAARLRRRVQQSCLANEVELLY